VAIREPEENIDGEVDLDQSWLVTNHNIPQETVSALRRGIAHYRQLKFLPRGPPASRQQALQKIHRGMGLPQPGPFLRALRERGVPEPEVQQVADGVAATSEGVRATAFPPPRNRAAPPKAYYWNEAVGWDIFVIPRFVLPDFPRKEDRSVLHGIDFAIRWHEAALCDNHSGEFVVDLMDETWVRRWGPPAAYMVDLGGSFDNAQLLDNARDNGFEIFAAASRAHWAHGFTERHGFVLKIIIVRVLVELRAKKVTITRRVLTMVVQEALLAKNSGANVDGKTPFQRLVGSNPRTRGLLESDLGMLAGARESLRIEIRGLSRKHLILADLDKRCRLAMAGYARVPQSLWPRGCAVHVQRGTHPIADPGSSGIGRVCGQDGSNVLIRFGGQYVRANPRFVRLAIGDGPG